MKIYQVLCVALLCSTAIAATAMAPLFRGDAAAILDSDDTDHDGRISRVEYAAAREKQFDRLDRNHDGVVSRDDFARFVRFRPQAGARLYRWIQAADSNHDGKVTRDELRTAPMPFFDQADTNHDGYIDQTEMKAVRATIDTAKNAGSL